ncbi:uncharacterized protein M8220_014790 isoform 2-T2 [Acridotheres tristis]
MDADPPSEELNGKDPPRPPVSPRPRGKVLPGVPKRSSVPVSPGRPEGTPRLEMLQRQVRSLQKVHRAAVQDLAKAQDVSEGLRRQLEQLEQHKEGLEESQKQVQESLQRVQLRRKEMEAKGQRRLGLFLNEQQELEGTEQEWEQLQHLRRQQRWQYCQELDTITDKLNHLHVTHTPDHLKAELMKLEKMEEELLSWERRVMETEKLLGPEAPAVMRLVQEEQEWVERKLEVELGRQQRSLECHDRCVTLGTGVRQVGRGAAAAAELPGD